jgi:hypothetical protein
MSEFTPALFPRDYEPIGPVERWVPVAGFEGAYEVSDLGRVRSLDRVIVVPGRCGRPCEKHIRGRILKSAATGRGYLKVFLGQGNGRYVHTLVAEAFHGQRPEGMEVCHGPGGMTDNRAVNLSWGTAEKNHGPDQVRDGTDLHGDRHHMAKLTWEQVDAIRSREWAARFPSQAALAREYGVCPQTISNILDGKTWRPEFRRDASQAPQDGHQAVPA